MFSIDNWTMDLIMLENDSIASCAAFSSSTTIWRSISALFQFSPAFHFECIGLDYYIKILKFHTFPFV